MKKLDHLDGLKHALKLIDRMEYTYTLMGIDYKNEPRDPFHDLRNEIRNHLGLKPLNR